MPEGTGTKNQANLYSSSRWGTKWWLICIARRLGSLREGSDDPEDSRGESGKTPLR